MLYYYSALLDDGFLVFLSFAGAVTMALLLGIALHEFCHALIASALGDTTAQKLGRLTLNPLAHLDPLGTMLMFLAGFGWGKPVPVNAYALRNGPRTGMALVAAAGPASNLAIAWAMAMPIRAGLTPYHTPYNPSVFDWSTSDYLGLFFTSGVLLNCTLAVFNFLPLAPLDGFRVWTGLLPIEIAKPLYRLEPYGMMILMGLFFLLPFVGFNFFDTVVRPPIQGLARAMTGVQ